MTNPSVENFFRKAVKWKGEFEELRKIVLDCGLTEDLKWGQPCYTYEGKNVVLIHGFKEYCALLFFKGALLKDPEKILIRQTDNVQAARQIRFTSIKEITRIKKVLKSYINEATALQEAGATIEFKKTSDFDVPQELTTRLRSVKGLRAAFNALTPGRQRAYLFYFSSAKQAKTREARIDKYVPKILEGKGIDD